MASDLENAIRKLVESSLLACGFDSGLCRYCGALVEDCDEQRIEEHSPDCPWQQVRSHYFPTPSRTLTIPCHSKTRKRHAA